MNRTVVAALFEDAFRQVLDDKVFRLLVGLAIVLILPTFLVGFLPDGITLLFGWKTWTYADLGAFGGAGNGELASIRMIGLVQEAIVSGLAGTFGLLFCVAATAFFVPRMLEKGAADTLFSKPVGRFALLVARYSAGVIFVACLSFLLVLGMHIGFLVTSGYSDPAFLWSALTLTYIFALIHSVSVTVAVLTRSSIAAILTTLIFFGFTGCMHRTWIRSEYVQAVAAESSARGDDTPAGPGRFQFLTDALDVVHWTLPKTTDADYVVAGLRRSITEPDPALRDTNGVLAVIADPQDFARQGPIEVDLETTPALWIARDSAGEETARIALTRRDRTDPEKPGKLRSATAFTSEFVKAIEADPTTAAKPTRSGRPEVEGLGFNWVRWRVRGTGADVERARGFTSVESALYEVEASFQSEFGPADDRDRALERFLSVLRVERKTAGTMSPEAWYSREFGWTSTFRHNAFVSIGSSVLFAILLLLLARWRLARIDF